MKVPVSSIDPGKTVLYRGEPCIVLEHRQEGTLLMGVEWVKHPFGSSNNFAAMEAATAGGMEAPGLLTDEEIGELLIRGKSLVQWYKDLEEYATQALLDGKPIPGWKLVAGRSNRAFTDQDAAIKAVIAAGYDEALVYDRKPKTLSQLEELMGKKEFKEKIGSFVVKPLGKPTLAEASDKREAYNPAAADFAGAVPE